jgi:hypothetical protein
VAVYVATPGGGYRLATTLTNRATMGRLTAPLWPGPHGLYDRGNTLEVELFGGGLSGLPEIDVLAGSNAAAVKTNGGRWEVLQFAEAELIGTRHYRLTQLLRGQLGTEQAMQTGADAGADFVLLDQAVVTLPQRGDELGLPLSYRIGPARDDHAAPSFAELTVTAEGVGLMPFAPVHLRARRDAGTGDLNLRWTRRTRFGGVGWGLVDVPLNEASEAYRLEILDGGDVVRSVELSAPAYLYTAAEQTADFGGTATGFAVRVAQVSAAVGPGLKLQDNIYA